MRTVGLAGRGDFMRVTQVLLVLFLAGVSAFASSIFTDTDCQAGGTFDSGATSCNATISGGYFATASISNISTPSSGLSGDFGLSFFEHAVTQVPFSPITPGASVVLRASMSETIQADGPSRAGLVTLNVLDSCGTIDNCMVGSSFGSVTYLQSGIFTIPVMLGDAILLAASVDARCAASPFIGTDCRAGGFARMLFQFFEADGVTKVGFTEAPDTVVAAVSNPEPASFLLFLVPASLVFRARKWSLAR